MEKERSQQEKDLLYFFLNEDMNDVIKIIKLLEGSGVLIDGVTETIKDEIKKNKKADFLKLCLFPFLLDL